MKVQKFKRAHIYHKIGFLYSNKNGGPVLKGESSWRNVNGLYLNTKRTGMICIEVRNHI
jgi:hypothetical protein